MLRDVAVHRDVVVVDEETHGYLGGYIAYGYTEVADITTCGYTIQREREIFLPYFEGISLA